MLIGFVFGLALLITIKQIPKLLGIEAHGDTALALVRDLLPHLRETDALTLAVGACGIAVMIVLERRLPRVPGALVVLLGSIAVSAAFSLEAQGVKVVGELPAGLAGPSLPGVGLEAVPQLFAGALGIALVAFAEAIGPANEFAREHGGKIDPNRELIALGAANTGAGLFSGFPIGSSLSKSAANDRAGAKTPASLITAAAATALVALFLTPLFESLPEATLGAIVIVAVAGMMNVAKMRDLWRLRRAEFWLAGIALVGVLVMPTLPALGIAVIVSLGMLVWRASQARLTFLGRVSGGLEPVDLRTMPDAAIPGLLIVRPDEMLFFANVASVREGIMQAVANADPRPTVVLLDLELTPEVDVPVVEALEHLHQRLGRRRDRALAVSSPVRRSGPPGPRGRARQHRTRPGLPPRHRRDHGVHPPHAGGRGARRRPQRPARLHPRARGTTGRERGGRRAADRIGGAALARAGGCGRGSCAGSGSMMTFESGEVALWLQGEDPHAARPNPLPNLPSYSRLTAGP